MEEAEEVPSFSPSRAPRFVRYAALFMDTSSEDQEEFDSEFLLYSYPANSVVIQRLKGLLIALNGVNKAVTGLPVTIASLEHAEDNDFRIKAAYTILNSTLFVVILPSYIADSVVTHLVRDQLALTQFMFGSVERLLREDPEAVKQRLDPLFETFFNDVFADATWCARYLVTYPLGVHMMICPPAIKDIVDDVLDKLAAASHDEYAIACEDPSLCLPIGACVYHRGVLISSQLPPRDTKEVTRYCQYLGLLARDPDSREQHIVKRVFSQTVQEDRLLSVFAAGLLTICLLLHPRAPHSGEPDPYFLSDMREALEFLEQIKICDQLDAHLSTTQPGIPSQYVHIHAGHSVLIPATLFTSSRSQHLDLLRSVFQACGTIRSVFAQHEPKPYKQTSAESAAATVASTVQLQTPAVAAVAAALNTPATSAAAALDSDEREKRKAAMVADPSPYLRHHDTSWQRHVFEYGIQLSQDGAVRSAFWVVGRRYPPDSEVFVVSQSEMPPAMMDVVFRCTQGLQ